MLGCGVVSGGSSPFAEPTGADPIAPVTDDSIDDEKQADDPIDPKAVDAPTPAVDPFPEDWIYAPAEWCDDVAHLHTIDFVVDGDTVELVGGQRVRYIGVDAPETYNDECFSQEAREALWDLVTDDHRVCLLEDSGSSPVDPYGRWLRYVFVFDGERWVMQNARLVRQGAARAYHQFLKGKDYAYEIKDAESKAKTDAVGLWSKCQ